MTDFLKIKLILGTSFELVAWTERRIERDLLVHFLIVVCKEHHAPWKTDSILRATDVVRVRLFIQLLHLKDFKLAKILKYR